jgi:HD-GYP domain-containing protein (c-di-GMP phosphodiesterase class II)
MLFNLNGLIVSLSSALDFLEMDLLGVASHHARRVTYVAMRMAGALGMSDDEIFDTIALSILHDNGIAAAQSLRAKSGLSRGRLLNAERARRHCELGEENVEGYPFLGRPEGVIRYHHENYDGSGYFGLSGEDIPAISRLIRLADSVELGFDLWNADYAEKARIREYLEGSSGKLFAPETVAAFFEASARPSFWLDLGDEYVGAAIHRYAPSYRKEMSLAEIRSATVVFSRIVDSKSRFTRIHSQELSSRAARMAARYGMGPEATLELCIAADLHDIGKLAVSNAILNKPGKLEAPEMDRIQRHTYYTRKSLERIEGFESITEWAANHHEKLDGSGYPYGKGADELDFNSRLMACLDIYQALVEERPYREPLPHGEAMRILRGMASAGKVDASIVEDMDEVFRAG